MAIPLFSADNAQLLSEFRKTRPDVAHVRVLAETPLLVAETGEQGWAKGELLGIFAHRGDELLQIAMLPNDDFPTAVTIDHVTPDSITFALAEDGVHTDNLKIFFDPKTWFPKRIVRFAPVRIRRISLIAGGLTLVGDDGKNDFKARERNGAWQITTTPIEQPEAPRPVETEFQINPDKAKQFPQIAEEKIGPYQKVGTKVWFGKTFLETSGTVGVGDIGYFDIVAQDWGFLHVPDMANWSASALLVEPDAIWAGLVRITEGADVPGGLLRYDRVTRKTTTTPLPDEIQKIFRVGRRLYCGTSNGFAIVDQAQVRRFEFSPQLDGSYIVMPVI